METKQCKKCGCAMPIDSKGNLCISCATRRWERIKMGIKGVAGTALGIIVGFFTYKKTGGKRK